MLTPLLSLGLVSILSLIVYVNYKLIKETKSTVDYYLTILAELEKVPG